jgi:hypothetical protein
MDEQLFIKKVLLSVYMCKKNSMVELISVKKIVHLFTEQLLMNFPDMRKISALHVFFKVV